MSLVTNLMLTTMLDDGSGSIDGEKSRAQMVHLGFARVDGHGGGNKRMECEVFLAAVNYLDIDATLANFRAVPWKYPEEMQMFVKRQDDEVFEVYTP